MSYILSKLKSLALWAIICTVFAVTFALYSLPLEAVIYAGAISGFFVMVFLTVDLILFRRKTAMLKKAAGEISLTTERLPVPGNTAEREYDGIIRALCAEKNAIQNENARAAADMSDYYTAWAHQIKTPITAMQMLLRDETPDREELSGYLGAISQYTDMVMCYLRVNSESTDLLIKEYELDDIVRQAVRKFSPQFIRKKLTLSFEPLQTRIVTDEKYLVFVIEQVLSNALKYTDEGGISIYLEEPLTLCISDTGIGIEAEDLPRVFEKGYTGINGRIDKRASGIGLYLCKRVCAKLGHEIIAESGGSGTTVKISLGRRELDFE